MQYDLRYVAVLNSYQCLLAYRDPATSNAVGRRVNVIKSEIVMSLVLLLRGDFPGVQGTLYLLDCWATVLLYLIQVYDVRVLSLFKNIFKNHICSLLALYHVQ